MAAEFGHETAARIVVQPPVDEPLHRRISEFVVEEFVEILKPFGFGSGQQRFDIGLELLRERFLGVTARANCSRSATSHCSNGTAVSAN
jgi:hypothetical protein